MRRAVDAVADLMVEGSYSTLGHRWRAPRGAQASKNAPFAVCATSRAWVSWKRWPSALSEKAIQARPRSAYTKTTRSGEEGTRRHHRDRRPARARSRLLEAHASRSGSERSRWPVSANTAFATAAVMGAVAGSPTPPILAWLGTMCTATSGISSRRSTS